MDLLQDLKTSLQYLQKDIPLTQWLSHKGRPSGKPKPEKYHHHHRGLWPRQCNWDMGWKWTQSLWDVHRFKDKELMLSSGIPPHTSLRTSLIFTWRKELSLSLQCRRPQREETLLSAPMTTMWTQKNMKKKKKVLLLHMTHATISL